VVLYYPSPKKAAPQIKYHVAFWGTGSELRPQKIEQGLRENRGEEQGLRENRGEELGWGEIKGEELARMGRN
jgi:hypothetical protein